MSNLVIVVDMQKGFVDPKGTLFVGNAGREILPAIQRLLTAEVAQGSAVVFTVDTHEPDDLEFTTWPPHCVRGTWECAILPELWACAPQARLQEKRRYSAFFDTDLDAFVKKLQPEKVIVMGVCTDICVMLTVADLRNRDYKVTVVSDAVATFDADAHAFALQYMQKILGAQVVKSATLLPEVSHVSRS